MVRDVATKLKLTREQQARLHAEISGEDLTYHEVLDVARSMFGGG